ncbi:MAG TPA: deoxynucleoside kinase [Burkholderiales bacterium]|nr:deoxynucleoside kinase [Burkholderiales bacterium]
MAGRKHRYIVVEGPIGAGKTSLARRLAEHGGADLLLESPERNPFLAGFYQDRGRWALATQLFFLFQRVNQLAGLKQLDLFERPTVADFLFDKDPLFARLNLSDDELSLYHRIYDHLAPQVPAPDLVIYLQAPVETLMARVRRRAAAYERGIAEDYLARLTVAYGRFFHDYAAAPLLIVNSEHLNFVDRPGDFALLLQRISEMRGPREFFNVQ